jgi:hypothetical protein
VFFEEVNYKFFAFLDGNALIAIVLRNFFDNIISLRTSPGGILALSE